MSMWRRGSYIVCTQAKVVPRTLVPRTDLLCDTRSHRKHAYGCQRQLACKQRRERQTPFLPDPCCTRVKGQSTSGRTHDRTLTKTPYQWNQPARATYRPAHLCTAVPSALWMQTQHGWMVKPTSHPLFCSCQRLATHEDQCFAHPVQMCCPAGADVLHGQRITHGTKHPTTTICKHRPIHETGCFRTQCAT